MLSENKFLDVLLKSIDINSSARPHVFGSIKIVLLLFEAVMSSEFLGKFGATGGCKNQLLLRRLANLTGSINMTDYKAQSPLPESADMI